MPKKIKINLLVENHKESQLWKCSVTVFVPKIAEIELNCTELIHFGRKEMELRDAFQKKSPYGGTLSQLGGEGVEINFKSFPP